MMFYIPFLFIHIYNIPNHPFLFEWLVPAFHFACRNILKSLKLCRYFWLNIWRNVEQLSTKRNWGFSASILRIYVLFIKKLTPFTLPIYSFLPIFVCNYPCCSVDSLGYSWYQWPSLTHTNQYYSYLLLFFLSLLSGLYFYLSSFSYWVNATPACSRLNAIFILPPKGL